MWINLKNRFNQTFAVKDNNSEYSFELKDVKTILNKRKGERSFFMEDYTLNPYMGCLFDCSYCYVNGSKYANKTNSIIVKSNAYELLKTQLKNKAKRGEKAIITLGSATECYMPIERKLGLTRDILKLINKFRFPVHIITKSDLILRDMDILKRIQESALLPDDVKYEDNTINSIITFSFSTTEDKIAKIFEYNAPRPSERLKIIDKLKKEGFLVGAALMPVIPFLSDGEDQLNKIFSDFKKHGVDYVVPGSLTLFGHDSTSSRVRYLNLLKQNHPEIYRKTDEVLGKRSYLSKDYREKLNKRVHKIANDFNIRTSIV